MKRNFSFNKWYIYLMCAVGGVLSLGIKGFSQNLTVALIEHPFLKFIPKHLVENAELQNIGVLAERLHEILWGPLSQLISGIIFVYICLRLLPRSSRVFYGIAVFMYLVITKFEIVFFPPYGDAIGGPFAEAIWLFKNNFNYAELLKQPGYLAGGPRVYVFTLYPSFLAFLFKAIPSIRLFLFINHMIVFALSAAIVFMVYDIGRKLLDEDIAKFLSLLLLFLPLYQAQTEAINMELPCAFFVLLSMYAFMDRKFFRSGLWATLAAFVKGTGVIACVAIFVLNLWEIVWAKNHQDKRRIAIVSVLLLVPGGLIVFSKYFLNDQHVSQGIIKIFSGWPSFRQMVIFYVFAVLFAINVFAFFRQFGKKDVKGLIFTYHHKIILLYASLWFLLFLNFSAVSPRYRVIVYPFLCLAGCQAVLQVFPHPRLLKRILFFLICCALIGSYGFWYGNDVTEDYVLSERTLEYRSDLKLNQKIIHLIEEKYPGETIVAPFILAQSLAMPELGYIKQKREVQIYGFPCQYGGIRNFEGIVNLVPSQTLYVATYMDQFQGQNNYKISPFDQIVDEVRLAKRDARLFRGGVALDYFFRRFQLK